MENSNSDTKSSLIKKPFMIPAEWLQYAPKPRPLTDGKEWNVFLSYRSVNRTWVLNLYDVLSEFGHKVFLDQYVLKPGDKLRNNLQAALDKTQAGILIWSKATRDSVWVNDEYDVLEDKTIKDKNFVFIPVTLDDTPLPSFVATQIYLDFSSYPDGPNGGDLLRLMYALARMPLTGEVVRFANEQNEAAETSIAQIKAAIKINRPQKLVQLFEEGGLPWKTTAALGCMAAEGLIKLKDNDNAIIVLEQLEKNFEKALRPKQLKGLALARRGKTDDLDKAQDILGVLYAKNHLDPETMGIYARTFMDKYTQSEDVKDLTYLIQSRELYKEAFDKAPDDYYTGINAAAKSVFIGTPEDITEAKNYADRVQKITGIDPVPGDYWKTATIGESFLIQKEYLKAGDMYKKAINMALTEVASHESTFIQALRLLQKLQPTGEEKLLVINPFSNLRDYEKLLSKYPS
jgi:tetratricopeptide (TPR) repeat protein